jgi:SpoVK/Ycf46/Vps4 family AAA+-type ATPase
MLDWLSVLQPLSSGTASVGAAGSGTFCVQNSGPASASAAISPPKLPPPFVVVVCATNRPESLDPAALRRMPRQIFVPLPSTEGRADILRRLLRSERVAPDFNYERVAAATPGFSGSDLKHLIRIAAYAPVREVLAARDAVSHDSAAALSSAPFIESPRGITTADALAAASELRPAAAMATPTAADLKWVSES